MLQELHQKDKAFGEINDLLRASDSERDFQTYLRAVPSSTSSKIVNLIDEILGKDLGSYWLWECHSMPGGGAIQLKDGRKFRLKTIKDLEKYLLASLV